MYPYCRDPASVHVNVVVGEQGGKRKRKESRKRMRMGRKKKRRKDPTLISPTLLL